MSCAPFVSVVDERPDGPNLDVRRVIETLDRHGVEYLLIGGMATRLHGATRPTNDIDVLPSSESENLTRLADALKELGAFLRVGGLTDDGLALFRSCWMPSR